jgi:hypothetical protein
MILNLIGQRSGSISALNLPNGKKGLNHKGQIIAIDLLKSPLYL